MMQSSVRIERWNAVSKLSVAVAGLVVVALAAGPALFSANAVDKLTTLFIYVILAVTWNALAGYGGLVSVGQQVFFGLGAYGAARLANAGVNVYFSLVLAAALVA